jgi:hypothetical protein
LGREDSIVLDQDQEQEPRRGMGKAVLIWVIGIVLGVGAYFLVSLLRAPAPEQPRPQPQATAAPAPPQAELRPLTPEPEPEAPRTTRPRPRRETPVEPPPPPPAEPAGPTLVIDSDVPGASVFVNRQYLGTTPLRASSITPGRHQLNASAEGEDGIAQTIDVGESGDTTITLRFKEVRLDATVAVVHKHGVGSCEGRLIASPSGLRYDTANKKDAFSLSFKEIEAFEIDYLKKELKLKQRGGKTWNFTDRAENADKLFVFHRDVNKAREKLAAQAR